MRSGLPGLAFLLAVLLARAGASESVLLLPLAGLSTAPDPLRAVLLRPQPTDNRPAAVMVHGFGGVRQKIFARPHVLLKLVSIQNHTSCFDQVFSQADLNRKFLAGPHLVPRRDDQRLRMATHALERV